MKFPFFENKKIRIEGGIIFAVVPENCRAWHAGISNWDGLNSLNKDSIGIELVNFTHDEEKIRIYHRYDSEEQLNSLVLLLRGIMKKYQISPRRLVPHSDIAPDRKQDPYPLFPFSWLYEQGLGMGVDKNTTDAVPEDNLTFFRNLNSIGYPLETLGYIPPETDARSCIIKAFQQHFTCAGDPKKVTGDINSEDRRVAQKLYEKYGKE